MKTNMIKLLGRLVISGQIKVKTGLHIGGGSTGIAIGGIDNPIIRDPLTGWPYIPGSSLKGKMRSLSERKRGFFLNENEVQKIKDVRIHICKEEENYLKCNVCQVFGVPGEKGYSSPTRLIVRDVLLDPESLAGAKTDMFYSEIKYEAAIDRITSAAVPRPVERVPAGAVFKNMEVIFSFYKLDDKLDNGLKNEFNLLKTVFSAMQMLEDDSLGGLGSRGSGKIKFADLSIKLRKGTESMPFEEVKKNTIADLLSRQQKIIDWAFKQLVGGNSQ